MNHKGTKDTKGVSDALNRLSHELIGVALEVHRHLGPGFLEAIYEEAMVHELELRGIGYQRQLEMPIQYKDRRLGHGRIDLLVGGALVVELKAVEAFKPIHRAQVLSYLKAGNFELGMLINFNVAKLRDGISRVILT